MNPNDPNVAMLEVVAKALGDELREETVFIGGAAAATSFSATIWGTCSQWSMAGTLL